MTEPLLSIVSPVYRAADIVEPLVAQIKAAVETVGCEFEIVLVEDASPDASWAKITAVCAREPRVRALRLSRNFGQHAAITAGIANSRGQYVVVMDCDLQDDPAYIPALLAKARAGFDIVLTRKETREHASYRNFAARVFNGTFNLLSGRKAADVNVGGYSLLSRKAADAFLRIHDVHRHYLLVLGWIGFPTAILPVEHRSRYSGESSYDLGRLFRHAMQGITSQSTRLLKISVGIGFLYVALAALGVIYLLVSYYVHGFRAGWASTIVLLLGSTGLILMAIGVLGIYLGNIFDQVRGRPLYLVSEQSNFTTLPH